MTTPRKVTYQVTGRPAIDGAGVHLTRVLGADTAEIFDPVLMLDSFDTNDPEKYRAGFPMHPHRGIETISYIKHGEMVHRDSIGNEASVTDGGIQWMCAGSGIMHEELIPVHERLLGAQLWLNLPQKEKMSDPLYFGIQSDEIETVHKEGVDVRVLAGSFEDVRGHQSTHLPVDYLELTMQPGSTITIPADQGRSVMMFTVLGSVSVEGTTVEEKTAAKLSDGDSVTISAGDTEALVLVFSSVALREPMAFGGPVVMNTREEVERAFFEMRMGTFLKHEMEV